VVKALSKKGFRPVRQRGSHLILENQEGLSTVVPRKDQIKPGTLLSIIDQAGLTKKEFLELL
jgi:predicted RNA binding protein YcfA (HicA-like mRNA interferase family)